MFGDVSGKLRISAIWPADHTDLCITYLAPQYAQLLRNLPPEAALKRLGVLVTLCPLSQKWVAAHALALDFAPSHQALRQEWLNADLWFFLQLAQPTPYFPQWLPWMMKLKGQDPIAWQNALGMPISQAESLLDETQWRRWCDQSEGLLAELIRYFSTPNWQSLWGEKLAEQLSIRGQRLIRLLLDQWQFSAPVLQDGWWQGAVPRGTVKHRAKVDQNRVVSFEIQTPTDARWQTVDLGILQVRKKASQKEWMSFIQALDPSVPLEWANDSEGQ